MATINERIQIIIDQYYKGNESELCRDTGIKQSTINAILGARKSSPSSETVTKIINARVVNINPTWLLTGKGSMLHHGKGQLIKEKECCPEVNLELEKAYWEIESLQKRIEKQKEDYLGILEKLEKENREIKNEVKDLLRENGSLSAQLDNLRKRKTG